MGKVREVGERAEVGEGTIGAIGSIEPTLCRWARTTYINASIGPLTAAFYYMGSCV